MPRTGEASNSRPRARVKAPDGLPKKRMPEEFSPRDLPVPVPFMLLQRLEADFKGAKGKRAMDGRDGDWKLRRGREDAPLTEATSTFPDDLSLGWLV